MKDLLERLETLTEAKFKVRSSGVSATTAFGRFTDPDALDIVYDEIQGVASKAVRNISFESASSSRVKPGRNDRELQTGLEGRDPGDLSFWWVVEYPGKVEVQSLFKVDLKGLSKDVSEALKSAGYGANPSRVKAALKKIDPKEIVDFAGISMKVLPDRMYTWSEVDGEYDKIAQAIYEKEDNVSVSADEDGEDVDLPEYPALDINYELKKKSTDVLVKQGVESLQFLISATYSVEAYDHRIEP